MEGIQWAEHGKGYQAVLPFNYQTKAAARAGREQRVGLTCIRSEPLSLEDAHGALSGTFLEQNEGCLRDACEEIRRRRFNASSEIEIFISALQ